jgi:CheY-like chemotaxis protein
VTASASGADALTHLDGISLVVSDVQMPGMSGTELVRQAKALKPDMCILFVSGDIGTTPLEAFAGHEVLAKPFTAFTLEQAVTRAVARK